jgi:hypothetical protein
MGFLSFSPAIASVASGLLSGDASSDAARAGARSQQRAIDAQQEMFETIRGDYAPYREAGRSALDAMLSMTGLPGLSQTASPTQPSQPQPMGPQGLRQAILGRGMRNAMGRMGNPGAGPTLTLRQSMYGGAPEASVLFPFMGMREAQSNQVPSVFGMGGYIERAKGGPIKQGGRYTLSEYGHPEAILDDSGQVQAVTTQPTAMTSPINGTVVPLSQTGKPSNGYIGIGENWGTLNPPGANVIPLPQIGNPMPGSSVQENPGGQPGRYNFMTDPGYQFRMDEGTRAIERSAAARGMGLSGSVLRELARYGQGLGSQEYGNVYNRISGIANLGAGGLAQTSQYGYGTAGNIAGNLGNIGEYQGAGMLGRNSAYQGILGQLGRWYGQGQSGQTPPIWGGG